MTAHLDSFELYCFAAEVKPDETLRVLGLMNRRLTRDPANAEDSLYKGALLARLGCIMADAEQSQRFQRTGIGIMRASLKIERSRSLIYLRMLYARGTTQAMLSAPPVTAAERRRGIDCIVDHPGFGQLHAQRQAVVYGLRAYLLEQQGLTMEARQAWQTARNLDDRIGGFPDMPPQIIL